MNKAVEKFESVAVSLNNEVTAVLSQKTGDFMNAFVMSSAIQKMKELLTDEYLTPIMQLQGSFLGFRTDKDKENIKYSKEIVKDCLITAVLLGVSPVGNQFNIISGNTYITKQGFTYLLKKMEGLSYKITYDIPTVSSDLKTAVCKSNLSWTYNGKAGEEVLEFQIKISQYSATADAIHGKVERKTKAWLYNYLNNTELPEGDVSEPIIIPEAKQPVKASRESITSKKYDPVEIVETTVLNDAGQEQPKTNTQHQSKDERVKELQKISDSDILQYALDNVFPPDVQLVKILSYKPADSTEKSAIINLILTYEYDNKNFDDFVKKYFSGK